MPHCQPSDWHRPRASQDAAKRLGARLALLVPLLASAACGTATTAPKATRVDGVDWRIDQAQREPIVVRDKAQIRFGPDGRMVGHTSCNAMSASYTLDGPRLKLGPVIATRMACPRLLMEQEDRILTALEHAVAASVRDDGLLELRDADGRGVLRGSQLGATP